MNIIQFDTLDETDLKGTITSINLTFFIWLNLKECSKFQLKKMTKLLILKYGADGALIIDHPVCVHTSSLKGES